MAESILDFEIHQQPEIIQKLLQEDTDPIREMVAALKGRFRYILIAARGTSDNAARYAQYIFGAHNRLPVALATPSLYTLYQTPPDLQEALVIGISQSGQSPDIVGVLADAKAQGRPTVAIVNDPESPLAATADYVIPLFAQLERAVAATKTYTASLAALALFSCLLEGNPDHLDQLNQMPLMMQKTISMTEPNMVHAERYRYMNQCTVVGRGFNYSTAFEIALKIKELTRVLAEPYSSADFRHGPIAVVQRGYPVILIIPNGVVAESLQDLFFDLKKKGSEVILISDKPELLEQAKLALPIPQNIPEWLSPMVNILPGQMFSMRLTMEKGMSTDQPEGLTKVTETF